MIKGIQTAASGMLPHLKKQEAIADNLANISTAGFKRDGVFLKVLSEEQKRIISTQSDWEEPMADEIYVDFQQGKLDFTGDNLNVALEGDGFFVVSTPYGERYTRNGAFRLDGEGFLMTDDGDKVLTDGGPVNLVGSDIKIDESGKISVDGSQVAQLSVVDFPKPYQLERVDGGLYAPKSADVVSQVAANYSIRQGFLERSNVEAIGEMVEMIDSFRDYEGGQKAIQIQDDSLGKLFEKLG
ncbi:MAG: flagellar basal-body rod protein FlgF [candidate division Zixibacteria bacterium]|nr:flagellar basal-body rod protein FlgF [candidate division Zixibacteria bacterium]